ncbi:MAG TPA: Clp protease N-terminal domain-containing protein, partial [Chitinophagaceae bacterium]|nr:Clp protease N-terminal domain-containing protein [Chitinophagaceae bacterium]
MNLGNLTIKAAEAFQQAQQIAFNAKSPNIETEHILKALLEQQDSPVDYLLKKNNVTVNLVDNKLDELIGKLPTTSGDAAQQVSREANNVILRAGATLKQFGDEFVTPEHLMLALVQGNDSTGKLLKDAGLTEKGLIAAIKELRKGETVTSQTQSQEFNALNKYAKNLNELARQGKLDPVIGRDEEIRRTLHILSRRTKNNPILVGEPGVGKTAIAEG